MLETSTLVVGAWTLTKLADGADAWIRPVTDAAGQSLGFVRYQKVAPLPWINWLRKPQLDVFETEDGSHLMTLTRSWTILNIWNLHDAEDRFVGSIFPKSLIASDGATLAYLGTETKGEGRIFDGEGQTLVQFRRTIIETKMTFLPGPPPNPFLRMLLVGSLLALDPKPKGA